MIHIKVNISQGYRRFILYVWLLWYLHDDVHVVQKMYDKNLPNPCDKYACLTFLSYD